MADHRRSLGAQFKTIENGERVGKRRWIRRGRAGGDHVKRIANHVRNDQTEERPTAKGLSESPALDARQVFANGIHLLDGRPTGVEELRDGLLVFERYPSGGWQQGRAAAREQADGNV